MKRGQKASQRRLKTKGRRGLQIRERKLQMRKKKAESTTRKMATKEDGKGLQKVKKEGKRGLSKRYKSEEKWIVKNRKVWLL